jgi:sugar phosphate isomerase/epimerase
LLTIARARVVVLGSGWTRNIPEGWTRAQAEDEFLSALEWCADALRGSGTTLAIEPLNRKESNLVNSVGDGARLARKLNRPEVRGLADFYHMDEENEPLDELREHCAWLAHIHLADTGRLNPGTGSYDYPSFFGHLKACGYQGLLSAECGFKGELHASGVERRIAKVTAVAKVYPSYADLPRFVENLFRRGMSDEVPAPHPEHEAQSSINPATTGFPARTLLEIVKLGPYN